MFCDIVGSTALSARLDPEDLRAVIGTYHRCAAAVIERAGGFVVANSAVDVRPRASDRLTEPHH
jgi:class 3 adenylate cyclase